MLTSELMEGRQVGRQQEKAAGGAGHNNQQLQTTGLHQGHGDEDKYKDKGKDKLKNIRRQLVNSGGQTKSQIQATHQEHFLGLVNPR